MTKADVAELVDARDLKSPGAAKITHLSDLTRVGNPHEEGGDPAVLSNTPSHLPAGCQLLENMSRRPFTDIDKPRERPIRFSAVRKLVSLRGCEHKALEAVVTVGLGCCRKA